MNVINLPKQHPVPIEDTREARRLLASMTVRAAIDSGD